MKMKHSREVSDEFGIALKHYLDKRKMSMTQLARESGVSVGYISRLIAGERKAPSVPITVLFIKTLGMPSSYLLKVLELEEEDMKESIVDLYDLILFSEFSIEGQKVETEVKEVIVDILQSIISSEWREHSIEQNLKVLATIAGKIEELKAQICA
jgi:transcriptional regulator with XRE-family HTH domain